MNIPGPLGPDKHFANHPRPIVHKPCQVRPSRKRPFLHSVAPSAPTGVTRPVGIPPHISVDY